MGRTLKDSFENEIEYVVYRQEKDEEFLRLFVLFVFSCDAKSRPCHPERSVAESNCEAATNKVRWDLGRVQIYLLS